MKNFETYISAFLMLMFLGALAHSVPETMSDKAYNTIQTLAVNIAAEYGNDTFMQDGVANEPVTDFATIEELTNIAPAAGLSDEQDEDLTKELNAEDRKASYDRILKQ